MPIKQTKPRKGAKPMTYFKGTKEELLGKDKASGFIEKGFPKWLKSHNIKLREYSPNQITELVNRLKQMSLQDGAQSLLCYLHTEKGSLPLMIDLTKKGNFLVRPWPALHMVTNRRHPLGVHSANPFNDLLGILTRGFRGGASNAEIGHSRAMSTTYGIVDSGKKNNLTKGDMYGLNFVNFFRSVSRNEGKEYNASIPKTKKSSVSKVIIYLERTPNKELREAKKVFYREQIQKRFGIPVKFV